MNLNGLYNKIIKNKKKGDSDKLMEFIQTCSF